jgi:geranylgeranyl transferase type-2 subunit beta
LVELDAPIAERAASFLRSRLSSHAAVVDFVSLIYSAALLEAAAGVDVFVDAAPGWRSAVDDALEQFRRGDGGYAKTADGHSSSTYYSFLVVLCRELLRTPIREPQRLADFIRSRRREDGGFVEVGPMKRSGTNPTAAAIGLLKILEALDKQIRDDAVDFLLDMQTDEGGLRANTRIPIADVLSTFTGLLTLANLEALTELDVPAARRFVEQLDLPGGGFRAALWDPGHDVEYTFYGLGSLALLSGESDRGVVGQSV